MAAELVSVRTGAEFSGVATITIGDFDVTVTADEGT